MLPMSESNQTLSDTSIEVKDGQTIMKFTKIMKEAGEIEITPGDNTFLWAHGLSDIFGYHSQNKASIALNLNLSSEAGEEPSKEAAVPAAPTSASVPDESAPSDELMVGDEVCITGYVMDNCKC